MDKPHADQIANEEKKLRKLDDALTIADKTPGRNETAVKARGALQFEVDKINSMGLGAAVFKALKEDEKQASMFEKGTNLRFPHLPAIQLVKSGKLNILSDTDIRTNYLNASTQRTGGMSLSGKRSMEHRTHFESLGNPAGKHLLSLEEHKLNDLQEGLRNALLTNNFRTIIGAKIILQRELNEINKFTPEYINQMATAFNGNNSLIVFKAGKLVIRDLETGTIAKL